MEQKEVLKIKLNWEDKNFSAAFAMPDFGAVIVTDKTESGIKQKFAEAMAFHIEGMKNDGDKLPLWAEAGNYELEFVSTVSAMLQQALQYTTLTALSNVTGMKHAQLSHYANAVSIPRPKQREKIITGLHTIGQKCLAVI
ncbi:MAG: CopG family transcriptional regulator [Paludibacteraceae bacterium]|nr:CopG family transcriptional regulator [Paludibacteraceae bacterium]